MGKKEIEEIRSKTAIRVRMIDGVGATLRDLFKWGTWAFLGWCGYLSLHAVAGKHTFASIVMNFAASAKLTCVTSYAVGAAGTFYGMNERRLRRRKLKSDADTVRGLETRIDSGRSSSGLAADGTTHPGD